MKITRLTALAILALSIGCSGDSSNDDSTSLLLLLAAQEFQRGQTLGSRGARAAAQAATQGMESSSSSLSSNAEAFSSVTSEASLPAIPCPDGGTIQVSYQSGTITPDGSGKPLGNTGSVKRTATYQNCSFSFEGAPIVLNGSITEDFFQVSSLFASTAGVVDTYNVNHAIRFITSGFTVVSGGQTATVAFNLTYKFTGTNQATMDGATVVSVRLVGTEAIAGTINGVATNSSREVDQSITF